MMTFTLAHELVHRAKAGSLRKYNAFANYLIREYTKAGIYMDDLVAEQMSAAKRAGVPMTEPEAFDEVVCDAAQRMFTDTNAGRKLANWGALRPENRNIVTQIREWLTELMDSLRSLFKDADNDSDSARAFRKLDRNVQRILADMFVDMSKDAAEKLGTIKAAGMLDKINANSLEKSNPVKYNDGKRKVSTQEVQDNGRRKEVPHRGDAESPGRVGKENSGREGSARESCERRIKEILRQKTSQRSATGTSGRGRVEQRETREAFESRSRREGLIYVELGKVAIAVQASPETNWNKNAKVAAEKLSQLGIDVVVFSGGFRHNQNGVTQTSVDGITVRYAGGLTIFISSELDADGLETAYHEAFHAARYGLFAKYHKKIADIIADNVDIESEAFSKFVSEIADLYAYTESDVSVDKFASEIIEEFYAWYVGKAYTTESGEMQVYMAQFSDAETIKSQIDGVYAEMEANSKKALPGLLNSDDSYNMQFKLAVREDTSAEALLRKVDASTVTPAQQYDLNQYMAQLAKVDEQVEIRKKQRKELSTAEGTEKIKLQRELRKTETRIKILETQRKKMSDLIFRPFESHLPLIPKRTPPG